MMPIITTFGILLAIFSIITQANSIPTSNAETAKSAYEANSKRFEEALTEFTVNFGKLLKANSEPEKNILYSPLNLYSALLLLHLGSGGTTQNEISTTLHVPTMDSLDAPTKNLYVARGTTPQKEFHEHYSTILNTIQNTTEATVVFGSGLFVQKQFPIKEEYITAIEALYDGEVANVDFQSEQEKTLKTINGWISEKTKKRIPELFKEPFSADTLAVIASSLYFSSNWYNTFKSANTKVEKFKALSGEVDAHLMNNQQYVPYLDNPALGYEAISIPYAGNVFSMYVVLPYVNTTLDTVVSALTPHLLQQLIKDTKEGHQVNYKIPRLKFDWKQEVKQQLSVLGIKELFNDADLSNMTTATNLKVSKVTHATEIEVSENGTVATAVTVFEIVWKSAVYRDPKVKVVEFFVNRPFMLLIVHKHTKAILFSGLVYKP